MSQVTHLVGSCYPAQTGGVDNAVYWYALGQKQAGIDVTILTTDSGLTPSVPRGITLKKEFGDITYYRNLVYKKFPLRWLFYSYRKIFKSSGIIHLHSVTYCSPFLLVVPFVSKSFVISIHGEFSNYSLNNGRTKLKKAIIYLLKLLKNKIYFHVTCDAEFDLLKKHINPDDKNIVQISIGKPIDILIPHNPDFKYFSFIGRLDPKKGIENLILGFGKNSLFISSNFLLLIAGEQNEYSQSKLNKLIKELDLTDKIKFIGHIEGQAKSDFLRNSYFNFMPSYNENFGIVTLEALEQGTPCVASIYTPWSILEKSRSGYWIDNTPTAIRDIVNHVTQLPPIEYEALRSNARKIAEENFDYRKIGLSFKEFYQSISE